MMGFAKLSTTKPVAAATPDTMPKSWTILAKAIAAPLQDLIEKIGRHMYGPSKFIGHLNESVTGYFRFIQIFSRVPA